MNTSHNENGNINNNILNTNHNLKSKIYPKFTSILKTDIQNINKPLYSEYNMVDIKDILYFFSKDIEQDRLFNIFLNKNIIKQQTKKNIKRKHKFTDPKILDLVCHLDQKYQKRQKKIKLYTFSNYLKNIGREYEKISDNKDDFAGWNYYNENRVFIKTYFDNYSNNHNTHNNTKHRNIIISNDSSLQSKEVSIIPYVPKKTEFNLNTEIINKKDDNDNNNDNDKDPNNITTIIIPTFTNYTKNNDTNDTNDSTKTICINTSSAGTSSAGTSSTGTSSTGTSSEDHIIGTPIEDCRYVYINVNIKTIDDLLILKRKYPLRPNIRYNINMRAIHNIYDALLQLNNMIGLSTLKESIIDQIIYYIQDFHKLGNNSKDFMHTVIYGPPGTGKTEIAKIIGEIFSKLGILRNKMFKKVTRADLVAGYLGQTAIKTKNLIKECLGGVLFIDEAYSLGNNEKGDSFSKECIDTLCEALSNYKDDIMVIIAGYKKELKECFFNYNEGLESRFSWRFETQPYQPKELRDIFLKKVKDAGWNTREPIPSDWFKKHYANFKNQGRDVEILFSKCKISHSRRVFCKPIHYKLKISIDDIDKGFEMYKKNEERNNNKNNPPLEHMYV